MNGSAPRQLRRSTLWKLQRALSRPLRLLPFDPIIQIDAVLEGINYGLLYFSITSFSALYVITYHESIQISGLHYSAICVGTLGRSQLCRPLTVYVYKTMENRVRGSGTPELRVPLMIPGAILTPIGLLLHGWAAHFHLFWLIVDIGATLLCAGVPIFNATLSAYIMDAYPEHVSSASAATQVLRSLLALAFPLFSGSLYQALRYGWENSLSAFLLWVGITMPFMAILWRFGARLRAKRQSSY